MPGQYTDDEIDEILNTYDEEGSMKRTAEEVGCSVSTVSKYVNQRKAGGLPEEYAGDFEEQSIGSGTSPPEPEPEPKHPTDALVEDEKHARGGASSVDDHREAFQQSEPEPEPEPEDDTPEGWTAMPPDGAMPEPDEEEDDFEKMDEGEFIEWFFNTRGAGVRSDFATNLSHLARTRGQLPDRAEMANLILTRSSGIGNDGDADMIAETYWAAAQRYLDANNHQQMQQQQQYRAGGGWTSGQRPGMDQKMEDPSAGGGDWVSRGGQGQQPQQPGFEGQQQQAGQGQPEQSEDPQVEALKAQMEDMQESVKMLANAVSQQQQQPRQRDRGSEAEETRTIRKQMEEFKQLNSLIQEMGNNNEDNGREEELRRELEQMRQQMQSQMQAAAQQDSGPNMNEMGEFGMIAQLASNDNISPEMVGILAEKMGPTDPEVRKAELEVERENTKSERQREMINEVFNGLQSFSGEAAGAVMSALSNQSGGAPGPAPQQEQEPAEQPQQPQQQNTPAGMGGSQTEFQSPGGSDSSGQRVESENFESPNRQRHRDRMRQQREEAEQDTSADDLPQLSIAEPGTDGDSESDAGGFDALESGIRGPGGSVDTDSMVAEKVNDDADEEEE